ncbi:MAG TPA: hypothetical protein VHV78_03420, partial [Gemmatimonadaceae bacterium]|nr:hypothetical protein [Gemmatimonadaceae bacterium]
MDVHAAFHTPAGTLRAPWRVLSFVVAVEIAIILVSSVAAPAFGMVFRLTGVRGDATEYWVDMLGILAATIFMLRAVEKRSWSDIWLNHRAARPRWLILGFVVGSFAIGLPVAGLIGGHWLRIESGGDGS